MNKKAILYFIFTCFFQFTYSKNIPTEYHTEGNLDFVSCHEAGKALVAYKLGFDLNEIETYKSWEKYKGITKFKKADPSFDFDELEKIDTKTLHNYASIYLAGSTAFKYINGNCFDFSKIETNAVNQIYDELVKRRLNDNLIKKSLYFITKYSLFSLINKRLLKHKIKKELYNETENLILDNKGKIIDLKNHLQNIKPKEEPKSLCDKILKGNNGAHIGFLPFALVLDGLSALTTKKENRILNSDEVKKIIES